MGRSAVNPRGARPPGGGRQAEVLFSVPSLEAACSHLSEGRTLKRGLRGQAPAGFPLLKDPVYC